MSPSLASLLDLYDSAAPLERAFTIPAPWYTDPAVAALELRAVFGRTWQAAGRAAQLASPGQFFTTEIAGEPLLAVAQPAGPPRAFFNVCRHHAAAVACGHGLASSFRCPYHGWTYSLDGSLKGVPDFQGVAAFDPAVNGLVPAPSALWENFFFVNLDPAAPPLTQFLGGLAPRIAPLEISRLSFFASRSYELNCNWKVYVDNYLDGGYHVPYLHKGLNSVLDYKDYTIENGERYCLQSSPLSSASAKDAALASTRQGDRAWYFWLYPNFMINIYEGVMDTNLVIPLAPDRTRVVFDFYFADVSEAAAERNARSVAVAERIQQEDTGICESVQRGLSSRAYGAGRLSVRREAGEWLFHRLLAADLRSALA